MDVPFAPPAGEAWTRVSPRLARMRRALVAASVIPLAAVALGLAAASRLAGLIAGIAAVLVLVWAWSAVGRNFRSWGYVERADDLMVTHGAMFRKLTVVPYGRMQLVDVKAGPIERAFGLVNVKLHTAAATTDAQVRGLSPADAGSLRDRLTALGEAHSAGL
ncbi:MAG TPA: PH domain-containing protein [Acidimicrobiales bacterium]|nr:PH domain-containing protein [Acidimicrobiales bacterium]